MLFVFFVSAVLFLISFSHIHSLYFHYSHLPSLCFSLVASFVPLSCNFCVLSVVFLFLLSFSCSLSLSNYLPLSIVFLCFSGLFWSTAFCHNVLLFLFSLSSWILHRLLCSYFVICSFIVVGFGLLLSLGPSSSRLHFLGVLFFFCSVRRSVRHPGSGSYMRMPKSKAEK